MNMLKKIKWNIIAGAVVTIILGVIIVLNPEISLYALSIISGALLFACGILTCGNYFLIRTEDVSSYKLIFGLIFLAAGIWILINPKAFVEFILIVFGILILLHGFGDFQEALEVKHEGSRIWWLIMIISILTIALAVVCFINPFTTSKALIFFVGGSLIIDGVSELFVFFSTSRKINKEIRNKFFRK